MEDGFENYDNFALVFSPWSLYDVDQSATYGITNITFPGAESPMAFIIFNPSATTPPMTSVTPHTGSKMAASFAAVNPPNNDWMIAPKVHMGTQSSIKSFAKTQTDRYGPELFQLNLHFSNPLIYPLSNYTPGTIEAPTHDEKYYDLSTYENRNLDRDTLLSKEMPC